MDIKAFNTFAEAFAALGAGQVKAVFGPDAVAAYYAERGSFDVGASGLNPGFLIFWLRWENWATAGTCCC